MDQITHPITLSGAREVNPFDLAGQLADVCAVVEPTAEGQLQELARKSALAEALRDWQPAGIHRALLAGASLEQVTEAVGQSASTVAISWYAWVLRQRSCYVHGRPGVTEDDYERVAAVFHPVVSGDELTAQAVELLRARS